MRPGSILLCSFMAAGAALAQGTTTLEFSFSNPGARAMGFGGAFIGLADDATAAYTNPAGLVQLVEPELSLEARAWSHDTPFTAGGRAEGQPSGIGIDTLPGLSFAVSTEDARGLSFLSWVQPFRRWSLALYRHQQARFESRFVTNGLQNRRGLGLMHRQMLFGRPPGLCFLMRLHNPRANRVAIESNHVLVFTVE